MFKKEILSEEERLARLRLARTRNVGSITFINLLSQYGSAIRAIERLPYLSLRGGARRAINVMSKKEAGRELSELDELGAGMLVYGEEGYPDNLMQISDPPPVISYWGHVHLLNREMVGVVGSRYSSAAGEKIAEQLCYELSENGIVIVSGLARGIDGKAHQSSLSNGTVGVMGSGFYHCYPEENRKLFEQIREVGLLVSEHSPDVGVQGKLFPRRNRIIAGLSKGVVIVEASIKSGSLITARMAMNYNRDVFAVPGSPIDRRANGCNLLIKEGAYLVENAQDVLDIVRARQSKTLELPNNEFASFNFSEFLGVGRVSGIEYSDNEISEVLEGLYERISYTPVLLDDLIFSTGYPANLCAVAITDLELAGKIVREPGGYIVLGEEILV